MQAGRYCRLPPNLTHPTYSISRLLRAGCSLARCLASICSNYKAWLVKKAVIYKESFMYAPFKLRAGVSAIKQKKERCKPSMAAVPFFCFACFQPFNALLTPQPPSNSYMDVPLEKSTQELPFFPRSRRYTSGNCTIGGCIYFERLWFCCTMRNLACGQGKKGLRRRRVSSLRSLSM